MGIAVMFIGLFLVANLLLMSMKTESGRPYRVEIGRLAHAIETYGFENINLSDCLYVTRVSRSDGESDDTSFFDGANSDYSIRKIHGQLYRFDYEADSSQEYRNLSVIVNIILAVIFLLLLFVLLFIRNKIIKPFEILSDVPYELSKGNLTVPMKENKYRFFGKFVWGMDMLRENLENHKQRELELLREKKMLVLSLSHDIKTPLSAIKLYAKSLSRGLYDDKNKQTRIAENINEKADEIGAFLSQIIEASREDFLNPEVEQGEFYLSALIEKAADYYREKFEILKIDFFIGEYSDIILNGHFDRSVEVLQNIIENAAKYGDGHRIRLTFSEEEGCRLITVENSGCTLAETDLPHIFESFIRGTNADGISGSGLGLFICRQLMHKMGGEIFAEIKGQDMFVTVVFSIAR